MIPLYNVTYTNVDTSIDPIREKLFKAVNDKLKDIAKQNFPQDQQSTQNGTKIVSLEDAIKELKDLGQL